MAVTRVKEHKSGVSPAAIAQMMDVINAFPEANRRIGDPFYIHNPHPNKYHLALINPEKLEKKKIFYGVEVVPAEEAVKRYKMNPNEVDKAMNCAVRFGCILCRYTIEQKLRKQYIPELRAIQRYGMDMRNAENALDKMGGLRRVDSDIDRVLPQNMGRSGQISDSGVPGVVRRKYRVNNGELAAAGATRTKPLRPAKVARDVRDEEVEPVQSGPTFVDGAAAFADDEE